MNRSGWTTWRTAALLAAALALGAAAVRGAETGPAEDETPAPVPADGTAAPAPGEAPPGEPGQGQPKEPGTRAEGGVEVFIPSEEISEDFAVSFPVDI